MSRTFPLAPISSQPTNPMLAIAHAAILSSGWRRNATALVCGAVGGLAMAPVNFFLAMVVAMTAAVWLIDGTASARRRSGRRDLAAAAVVGWFWGLGFFLCGLWWLGAAFLVEPNKWAWALPLGTVALPAALALFPAVGFALARLLWSPGPGRILALSTGLGASEWFRGHVLSGFPWNTYGMALGGHPWLAQFAAVAGVQGLTIVVIAICASPATIVDQAIHPNRPFQRWAAMLAAGVVLLGLAGFGALRLGHDGSMVKGVKLRIMQPNVLQDDRFRGDNKEAILSHYLSLSDRATSPTTTGIADVTHLIWPESAFPFLLARDPQALSRIGQALPSGTTLVTGAARLGEAPPADKNRRFFNSIQVVQSGGRLGDSYDKVHLVPFGEYLPLSTLLRSVGVQQFVHIPGGFDAGPRRKILNVPGLPPVVPLICYEAVFSGEVMPEDFNQSPQRTGLLLNVTNDGWFGRTFGPYQHLAQAQLRSLEEGLPMVRAANTGVSAVIDPYGRVIAALPLGVEDVLDSPLPQAIAPTVFARYGRWTSGGVWAAVFFGCLWLRRRQKGLGWLKP
jgi:apolipoprotein N-acyltransferase